MLALGKFFPAGIYDEGVVQIQRAPVRRNMKVRFALANIGYEF